MFFILNAGMTSARGEDRKKIYDLIYKMMHFYACRRM